MYGAAALHWLRVDLRQGFPAPEKLIAVREFNGPEDWPHAPHFPRRGFTDEVQELDGKASVEHHEAD